MKKNTTKTVSRETRAKQRAALVTKVVALRKEGLSFRGIEKKMAKALGIDVTNGSNGYKAFKLFRLGQPVKAKKSTKKTAAAATA